MRRSGWYVVVEFAVALSLFFGTVGPLAAQPRGSITARPSSALNSEDELAPSQMKQPMPAAVSEPPGAAAQATAHASPPAARPAAAARKPAAPSASRTVIACSGPFAQDSGMLELAMIFGSSNMIFTEEKVDGSAVGATVLYPKDPRRRLEVWWSNPNRTGLYLIDIAGKSVWTGPDGLRLGLTLPALEKLNHKPFKTERLRQGRRRHGEQLGRRRARRAAWRLQGQRELSRRCEISQGCRECDFGGLRI